MQAQMMSGPEFCLTVERLGAIRDDSGLYSNLTFSLGAGQGLLIEGDNGSGKTTLLRTLAGIRAPDEGEISWCRQPVTDCRADYLGQLRYVGHQAGMKRDLTARENLLFVRDLNGGNTLPLSDVLRKVGLAACIDRPVAQLSAGQHRRLALARLLLGRAALWLLDEPFTSLDKDGSRWLEVLLEQHLLDGGLLVMSAHHEVGLPAHLLKRLRLGS